MTHNQRFVFNKTSTIVCNQLEKNEHTEKYCTTTPNNFINKEICLPEKITWASLVKNGKPPTVNNNNLIKKENIHFIEYNKKHSFEDDENSISSISEYQYDYDYEFDYEYQYEYEYEDDYDYQDDNNNYQDDDYYQNEHQDEYKKDKDVL